MIVAATRAVQTDGFTLFTGGTTRGLPPCILLEELGQQYEVVKCDLNVADSPHRKVNPLGRIPVLLHEGRYLDQYTAIMIYLAERFDRFLPKCEPARSEALRLLMHTSTDVLSSHAAIFSLLRETGEWRQPLLDAARTRLLVDLRYCDGLLSKREWLAGEYSIADMALYAIVGQYSPVLMSRHALDATGLWLQRIRKRPAIARAEKACPYDYDVSSTLG